MAVAALIGMYRHRGIGLVVMTADTERGVEDMAQTQGRVVFIKRMEGRRGLVTMAVQTVNRAVVGVFDNHPHRGAGCRHRIDITGFIMTGGATTLMGSQDIFEVEYRVAVRAILGIGLGQVGRQVDLDAVIDDATGSAMIMAIEEA